MDIKDVIIGVVLAILAFLKPIEGELWSLVVVFGLNFLFGYPSGMIANGENFSLKKAVLSGDIFMYFKGRPFILYKEE